jgi:hypothetical protein
MAKHTTRKRANRRPRPAPKVQRAAAVPAPEPAPTVALSAIGQRMRDYRVGMVFTPLAIPPMVAAGNVLVSPGGPTTGAQTNPIELLVVALVVYLMITFSMVSTVRAARRRGHGWPGSLLRGAAALGVCLCAVLMGSALSLSANDVTGV